MEQSYIMFNDVKEQNSFLANTFFLTQCGTIVDYLTSSHVELTPDETDFRSAGLLGIRTLHRPSTKCNVLASPKVLRYRMSMLTASSNWKRPKNTKFQKFSWIVDSWIVILQINSIFQNPILDPLTHRWPHSLSEWTLRSSNVLNHGPPTVEPMYQKDRHGRKYAT